MAKVELSQVADTLSIQLLINQWAAELDVQNGLTIGDLLTEDCLYAVRGGQRTSRADVEAFYQTRLTEYPDGPPIHRHAVINQRTTFTGADTARTEFGMIYWTTLNQEKGTRHADPALLAEVTMECRRCVDGHWRIARFDSAPVFIRT